MQENSVSQSGSSYTGTLRKNFSSVWYMCLCVCVLCVSKNRQTKICYLFIWNNYRKLLLNTSKQWPIQIPLNPYSPGFLQKFSPQIRFWTVLWVVSIHRIWIRSLGKKWVMDFIGFHCCYILKTQSMMKKTYPKVMNMKAIIYCACLQSLPAVWLGTSVISSAREVGMSP